MANIQIIQGDFEQKLKLQLAPGIRAGFPSDGKGQANVFANAIKHDYKSKNPTTRWSDIIVLK